MQASHVAEQFVSVRFFVYCQTNYGQEVIVTGNVAGLGSWDPLKGLKLQTSTQIYPRWELPNYYFDRKQTILQFKFVIIENQKIKRWESIFKNRIFKMQHNSQITSYFGSQSMQIVQKKVLNIKCRQGTYDILNEMTSDWGSSVDYSSNYELQNFYKVVGRDSGVQTQEKSQKSSDLIDSNQNLQLPEIKIDQPQLQNQEPFFKKAQNQQEHKNLFHKQQKIPIHNMLLMKRQKSKNLHLNLQNSEHSQSHSHRSYSKEENDEEHRQNSKKRTSPVLLNISKLQSFNLKRGTVSQSSTKDSKTQTQKDIQNEREQKGRKSQKTGDVVRKQSKNYSTDSQCDNDKQYIDQREEQVSLQNFQGINQDEV